MTRDDIIQMAKEAWGLEFVSEFDIPKLARFAALVAAAEREARVIEQNARKAAQEQLYAERERHTAEVKRLQAEIGRLKAPAASVSDQDIALLFDKSEMSGLHWEGFSAGARAILALRPAQAGVQHFGWAYDFLDGVRIVNDWVTSSKDEAFKPGHFNQRELLAAAHKEGGPV